jgi:hypothetical protein
MMNEMEVINPQVNAEAEFLEILNDFGDPLEILREGISNAIDAHATWIKVAFSAEEIDGARQLVINMLDNGHGMTREVLTRDFWGLGYSPSRERDDAIGEKGHGTKIYLRSEHVEVRSQSNEGAYFSICERPLRALSQKKLHQPKITRIDNFLPNDADFPLGTVAGTAIKIVGYNNNEYSRFVQSIVKDYLLWFTKMGSIERVFDVETYKDFKVHLKCLDHTSYELIDFGHPFPPENSDIVKLFDEKGAGAADSYVKRYVWKGQRLENHPFVTFDAVISVEGDEAKRSYNPMLRERLRAGKAEKGHYRASDRYGIWLCKDFIPVVRKNDWIIGFGSGSNSFVLLHGFINCQSLKLTANRGDIANTDIRVWEELKTSVQKLINQVDNELDNAGIYTLREWQDENRTLQQEKTEFSRRIKKLKNRKVARLENRLLVEPNNESELFGVFITVYALHPEIFDFEPIDYNTTKGIDIIARNKSPNMITEGEHSYIELKYSLQKKKFNHAFDYLRWIICWDFDKTVIPGVELQGIEEPDVRQLQVSTNEQGFNIYFLNNPRRHNKIQVIRLKEYLKQRLKLEFEAERQ